MFLHLSVSHSVHWGWGVLHRGWVYIQWGSASKRICIQGSQDPQPPIPPGVLWDMVNEWMVYILLECILVKNANSGSSGVDPGDPRGAAPPLTLGLQALKLSIFGSYLIFS